MLQAFLSHLWSRYTVADLPSIWLPSPSAGDPPCHHHPLLSCLLWPKQQNRKRNQGIRSCKLCLQNRIISCHVYWYLDCNRYQTYSVKYLMSDSYRVWKVMMLKARWGGKPSLFPQYPAGFGLTRPEPAHPAQPEGHPDKRIKACESLNTLSRTAQAHLCKACWNPNGAPFL